ncbi:hypothetical protein GLO73106DRAFT_00040990, partial [Gloeocapsa sp. PCC 73106]
MISQGIDISDLAIVTPLEAITFGGAARSRINIQNLPQLVISL